MLDYVLLVDRSEDEQQVEMQLLKMNRKYRLIVARTARAALRMFKQVRPAVVLINFQLPDMTGVECLRLMRGANKANPAIYLYNEIITSHLLSNAAAAGAMGCFPSNGGISVHIEKIVKGNVGRITRPL